MEKFRDNGEKSQSINSNRVDTRKSSFIDADVVEYLRLTFKNEAEIYKLVNNLIKSPSNYYIRVNLTLTSVEDIILQLKDKFPSYIFTPSPIENMISIKIPANSHLILHHPIIYCDKFAAEAVRMGANLYIPGVTEIEGSFPAKTSVSVVMDPKKVPESFPFNLSHFHVANGIAQIASKEFPKKLNGIMVETIESRNKLPPYRQNSLYSDGFISDQHLYANLATKIFTEYIVKFYLQEKHDPIIFDTCSAPGHKTSAMAEWGYHLTKKKTGSGHWFPIKSIDRSKNRLLHLEHDISRLKLENIEIYICKLEKIEKKYPNFIGTGDFIFFDPPCSALGPRPKLYISKNKTELEDFARNQRRLLKLVDKLIHPGGYLMYNTCTFAIQENENIVAYALTKLNYRLIDISSFYPQLGNPGLIYQGISPQKNHYMRRFYPSDEDGQGYFIALLQKNET
ncbi:MAG: hypothetical protein DRO88_09415 [Promethearchaeia archaeon]|nr:MAG: hypothetical protein DRO88_09415 [Candidatus Lokiarchaeia archaeon]